MPLSVDLRETVAFVTGATSGIGAHAAATLARAGARVVLGARRVERLRANAAAIADAGGAAHAVSLDVTDEASIEAAFASAEAVFGPMTLLLNNAGIGVGASSVDQTRASFEGQITTNLVAPWLVARAFARRAIAAQTAGSIVNIASIAGRRAAPGLAAYGASKAGLISLTESLALEWARFGIRVNAIAPGYIKTELNAEYLDSPAGDALVQQIPLRRLGRVDDLDGALLLLASDAGAWITGSTITVDGGHVIAGW